MIAVADIKLPEVPILDNKASPSEMRASLYPHSSTKALLLSDSRLLSPSRT